MSRMSSKAFEEVIKKNIVTPLSLVRNDPVVGVQFEQCVGDARRAAGWRDANRGDFENVGAQLGQFGREAGWLDRGCA